MSYCTGRLRDGGKVTEIAEFVRYLCEKDRSGRIKVSLLEGVHGRNVIVHFLMDEE